MVYRSSRKQAARDQEPESFSLHTEVPDASTIMAEKTIQLRRQIGLWRAATLVLIVICIGLAIGLAVMGGHKGDSSSNQDMPTCGESGSFGAADSLIDLREPTNPGPFHDLTQVEIRAVRTFLENDPKVKAIKGEDVGLNLNVSVLYTMDLFMPKKAETLKYLDGNGKQPIRQARAMMYRGDLKTPLVEEYICGPLPKVSSCSLLKSKSRRNPVEFSLRPFSPMEFGALYEQVLPRIEKEIRYILIESFGTSFSKCKPEKCLRIYPSPIGTKIVGDINKRYLWVWANFQLEYYASHPTGFGILIDMSNPDTSKHTVLKLWYNQQMFDSTDELIRKYNSSSIQKVKVEPVTDNKSSLKFRGDPLPKEPKRPPTQVEPDGKRYSLKDRKVEYLGWTFNFRMSALTGPALFDIRYKGERIAYELSMAEIGVFYSANNPMHRITDYVDSAALLGSHSKALIPGGDCPESATFINHTFPGQVTSKSVEINRAFCLFENNNGYPLRRHLSYANMEGGFYSGLMDSVLNLRSALTIANYDYIIDFIFHQNGVIESRVMSTGYIFPSFFTTSEKPYGFHIDKSILGNLHHHIFHFKADLDIGGTSNRYETLDIKADEVKLRMEPKKSYHQTRFEQNLKKTEKEALYKFNFDHPRYHVVHNNRSRTKFGEIKAYRIGMHGMSKQMIPENKGNEGSIPWARHQLVVTKHKDDELVSSSPYGMFDSANPVTDFTQFYADDENIVDEDLVFWITEGMQHIPHTEDLPVTPTVGNHLIFFLFPYNYFEECPSMASRDQIRIDHKDNSEPSQGLKINRNGNKDEQCVVPKMATAFDKLLEDDPDAVLETKKFRGIY